MAKLRDDKRKTVVCHSFFVTKKRIKKVPGES